MSDQKAEWDAVMNKLGLDGFGTATHLAVPYFSAVGDHLGVHLCGFLKPKDREEWIAQRVERERALERRREKERERMRAYLAEQERTRPMRSAIKSRELRRKQKQKR